MKVKSKLGGKLKRLSGKGTRRKTIRKKGSGVYLEPYRSKTGCGLKKKQPARRRRRRRRQRGKRRR